MRSSLLAEVVGKKNSELDWTLTLPLRAWFPFDHYSTITAFPCFLSFAEVVPPMTCP